MTNPFTTKLDMKTGTINICGGDTRFPILIDEWPEVMEKAQAEYERAKAIMGNPLLDTRGVDEAIHHYYAVLAHGGNAITLKPLVEFYQNTLVMWSELKASLNEVTRLMTDCEVTGYKLQFEIGTLNDWRDKLAAILEAHKQHMPE